MEKIKQYGHVIFFRENRITGTNILTGSLTFKMKLKDAIPSFIFFGPICLAVNYEGQTPTCRKCDSTTHIARDCQIKRCFNCGESGNLNRQCQDPVKCQGCSSQDHCFEQCPFSWEREELSEEAPPEKVPEATNWSWGARMEADQPLGTDNSNTNATLEVDTGASLIIDESGVSPSQDTENGQRLSEETLEMPACLKRTHDPEESSIVTVSRRRPGKKKHKDSRM